MGSIDPFGSQENLRQDIYLTQGVNETYSAFACRVSGIQLSFKEPDRFLIRMGSESSNSSQGSFKNNFGYAFTSPEYSSLPGEGVSAAQRYYFHLRADTLKKASSGNNDRAAQALIEQPERQSRNRETGDEQKKTFFQRLLSFLTRCLCPASM